MKKSVIILSSVFLAFSSAAIVYLNQGDFTQTHLHTQSSQCAALPQAQNDHPFVNLNNYRNQLIFKNSNFPITIESRFNATISKEKLQSAISIHNLVPAGATDGIVSFQHVKISKLVKEDMLVEYGKDGKLNPKQITLLNSLDYSNNFSVEASIRRENEFTGEVEQTEFVYYITVVPETQASYEEGHDALIKHFQEHSKNLTVGIKSEEFQPAKVRFTITKYGKIDAVEWESTSGKTEIDLRMIELLNELPGKWIPATNAKGENVDQELILSFGSIGC